MQSNQPTQKDDFKAPKPTWNENKGARFVKFFTGKVDPKMIATSEGKVRVELNKLGEIAKDVESKGGDKTEFSGTIRSFDDKLTTIMTTGDMNSGDGRKDVYNKLQTLKDDVRVEVAVALDRAPEAIREGLEETRKKNDEETKLQIAKDRATIENYITGLTGLSKNFALEDEPKTLLQRLQNEYGATANAKTPDELAVALGKIKGEWRVRLNLIQTGSIPSYEKIKTQSAILNNYLDKLDKAEPGLPKDDEAQGETLAQVQGLRTDLKALREDIVNRAKDTRLKSRLFDSKFLADRASQVFEHLKAFEVSQSLPKDGKERAVALDKLAAQQDGDTLDGQATLRVAMEMRFGVKFVDEGLYNNPLGGGVKKLDKLYEVLKLVPPSNLKWSIDGGPSKITFEAYTPDKNGELGAFRKTDKILALTPPIDGHISKKVSLQGEDLEYDTLTSSALHELGHAVDLTGGFMVNKLGQAEYGGWVKTDRDSVEQKWVAALAKIAGDNGLAAELKQFVSSAIGGMKLVKPQQDTEKLFKLAPHWDKFDEAVGVMGKLLQTKMFWFNGSPETAARLVGDGYVYFEAYDNEWWSYPLSARASGLTKYQWRAPTEWFAECYMLHYLGKLSKDHVIAKFCSEQQKNEMG